MTYQPPPPPPPGNQPYGPGGASGFDPKAINPLDWGIIGAGVLAFLLSFIDFYDGATISTNGHSADISGSASAWNDVVGGGFFAWFAMLFAIAGAVFIALELFASQIKIAVGNRLVGLGLFALATLFEIIAIFVTPGDSYSGFGESVSASLNHGFGFWASLIVIIAGLVLSLMRLQATGGQLPGGMSDRIPNIGGYGPQGGLSGSTGAPRPAPGAGMNEPYNAPYNPPYNPPPPPPPSAPPTA